MRQLFPILVLLGALSACGGSSDTGGSTPPADVTPETGATDAGDAQDLSDLAPDVPPVVAPIAWSDAVEIVAFIDETSVTGDTSSADSLGGVWGYQTDALCWLITESSFYGGPANFYAPSPVPPQNSKLTVNLTPDDGVDLNLVVMTMPLDAFWLPPTVQLASCYASRSGGPGEAEEKKIFTITDVANVLVMVVAPEESAGGGYELSFVLEK